MKALFILRHILLVGDYFIRAWLLNLVHRDPLARRRALIKNVSRSGRNFCKSLQITPHIHNPQRLQELRDQAYLMVSNHTSYTDILVLGALENLVFITSVEMGNNPFLGAITRLGGCLYTDRKNPVSLKDEIKKFSDTIAQGFKVLLFPEGTSTDGTMIRDFRRSLFQIALNVNCPILPVCIKYTKIDERPITDANRDLIAWYGDMTFAPHFLKLLNHKIEVEIHFLESVVHPEGKTRTELSDGVLTQIRDCFDSI